MLPSGGITRRITPAPRANELRSQEAYRRTLALITEGGLTDGDRLPSEIELAARFGISRPLIRQALSRLQAAGVVDVRWGAGSYVRDPGGADRKELGFGTVGSLEDVRHSFELRQAVEGDAAALAAARRAEPLLDAIRRAIADLEEAVETGAIGQDADLAFHRAVATAAQNPFFERALHSLQRPMEFSIGLARVMALTYPKDRLRLVQSEHVAILHAIEAGEPELARQTMRAHLMNSCRRLFLGPAATTSADSDA